MTVEEDLVSTEVCSDARVFVCLECVHLTGCFGLWINDLSAVY